MKKAMPADRQGFTLIEVLISIAVIIAALVGSLSLATISVSSISINKSKIIAASLAEEGLEIVKNIRENNWINRETIGDWRTGLGQGDWRVQYNMENILDYRTMPLRIDANNVYQYDSGSNTVFYRKITIEHIGSSQIKVITEITWQEKGKNNILRVEARFYDWL